MRTNLVALDRAARVGGGLFLLATPILDLPTYPLNLLGAVLIATGLIGYCPIYALGRALFPRDRSKPPPVERLLPRERQAAH